MAKKTQRKVKLSVSSPKTNTGKKKKPTKAKSKNIVVRSIKKRSRMPAFLRRILDTRHGKPLVALVFILFLSVVGSLIYNQWADNIANAVAPLNKTQCLLRGRKYTNTCTKTCSVGKHVVDTPYDYCTGSVSTSLSQSTCSTKGRVWLTGNGCARNPFQTKTYNALQCVKDKATYNIAGIDYCSGGTGGGSGGGSSGGGAGGWTWPVPGRRVNGAVWGQHLKRGGTHKGIDIGAPRGTKVVAAHGGTVTKRGTDGVCGPYLVVKASGTNYWYAYQHLQNVTSDNSLSAGQKIGEVGPGGTTSCGTPGYYHLHFSVEKGNHISYRANSLSGSINPCAVLPGC